MNTSKHLTRNTPLRCQAIILTNGELATALLLFPEKKEKSLFFTFFGVTHNRKSGKCMGAAGVCRGITHSALQMLQKEMDGLPHEESILCFMKRLWGQSAGSRKPWRKFYGIIADESGLPPIRENCCILRYPPLIVFLKKSLSGKLKESIRKIWFQWPGGLFFLEGSCYNNVEKSVIHSR